MKIDVNKARADIGLNCEYEGHPGKAILVSDDVIATFGDDAQTNGPDLAAGDIVVLYRDGDVTRGKVLNAEAKHDLDIVIRDLEGDEQHIRFDSLSAVLSASRLAYDIQNSAIENEIEISAKLENALSGIRSYAESAFTHVVEEGRFAAPEDLSIAFSYRNEEARRRDMAEVGLTAEEMDKIQTARALRVTIGRAVPGHADALDGGDVYVPTGKVTEVVGNVRSSYDAPLRQALRADRELSEKVFGVITKTPISGITAHYLDAAGFATVRQDLRGSEVKATWGADLKDRISGILNDRMPGYEYRVELFSRGGADVMLVRDHAGSFLYGWDSDSRVEQLGEALMFDKNDVPTDEEIARLRDVVADLRYETGEQINFDFFGEEDEVGELEFDGDEYDDPEYDDDDPEYDDYADRRL